MRLLVLFFFLIQTFQVFSTELKLPDLYFSANSLEYDSLAIAVFDKDAFSDIPKAHSDSIILFMHQIMKDNPTLVITITGHASFDEEDQQKLSEKRSKKVFSELVKLGVNPKRLNMISYGDQRLILQPHELNKCPEVKCTSAINRRVSFNVIGSDFKE